MILLHEGGVRCLVLGCWAFKPSYSVDSEFVPDLALPCVEVFDMVEVCHIHASVLPPQFKLKISAAIGSIFSRCRFFILYGYWLDLFFRRVLDVRRLR